MLVSSGSYIIHIQLGCLAAPSLSFYSARHGHRLATGTLLRSGLSHNAEMLGSKVEWWLLGSLVVNGVVPSIIISRFNIDYSSFPIFSI